MRFRLAILIVASVAFSSGLASSANAAHVEKPLKPDFSSMSFQLGTWSCTVMVPHRGSTIYTAQYSIDPSGYYMVRRMTDHGAPWFPYPTKRTIMITYDDDIKQWARVETSNFGEYELDMSAGWTNRMMVWHAVVPPSAGTYRSDLTLMKVSDTRMTGERTYTTKTGTTVGSSENCIKSS